MQQLLSITICEILFKNIRQTITRLCSFFFSSIWSKVIVHVNLMNFNARLLSSCVSWEHFFLHHFLTSLYIFTCSFSKINQILWTSIPKINVSYWILYENFKRVYEKINIFQFVKIGLSKGFTLNNQFPNWLLSTSWTNS